VTFVGDRGMIKAPRRAVESDQTQLDALVTDGAAANVIEGGQEAGLLGCGMRLGRSPTAEVSSPCPCERSRHKPKYHLG
jgi:hypothetical protein